MGDQKKENAKSKQNMDQLLQHWYVRLHTKNLLNTIDANKRGKKKGEKWGIYGSGPNTTNIPFNRAVLENYKKKLNLDFAETKKRRKQAAELEQLYNYLVGNGKPNKLSQEEYEKFKKVVEKALNKIVNEQFQSDIGRNNKAVFNALDLLNPKLVEKNSAENFFISNGMRRESTTNLEIFRQYKKSDGYKYSQTHNAATLEKMALEIKKTLEDMDNIIKNGNYEEQSKKVKDDIKKKKKQLENIYKVLQQKFANGIEIDGKLTKKIPHALIEKAIAEAMNMNKKLNNDDDVHTAYQEAYGLIKGLVNLKPILKEDYYTGFAGATGEAITGLGQYFNELISIAMSDKVDDEIDKELNKIIKTKDNIVFTGKKTETFGQNVNYIGTQKNSIVDKDNNTVINYEFTHTSKTDNVLTIVMPAFEEGKLVELNDNGYKPETVKTRASAKRASIAKNKNIKIVSGTPYTSVLAESDNVATSMHILNALVKHVDGEDKNIKTLGKKAVHQLLVDIALRGYGLNKAETLVVVTNKGVKVFDTFLLLHKIIQGNNFNDYIIFNDGKKLEEQAIPEIDQGSSTLWSLNSKQDKKEGYEFRKQRIIDSLHKVKFDISLNQAKLLKEQIDASLTK